MTTTELTVYAAATVGADTRTFSGVAAPYMQLTGDSRKHQFAAGMFGDTSDLPLVAVYAEHSLVRSDQPVRIGRVDSWDDREDGLHFSARLNDTEAARAIHASLKDGSLDSVSVSILATASDVTDEVTTYTAAELLELSVVAQPAFAGARILLVNSLDDQPSEVAATSTTNKESHMEITETAVADLRDEVTDLARSFAQFTADRDAGADTTGAPAFQSFGEVVKAVSKGDERAIAEIESFAYTGGTTTGTNVKHAWAAPIIKVIDNGRPVLNLFNKLPDPGANVIEYLKLGTSTIDAAEQVNEGDDLAYGKIALTSETASMKTYGGWFDWSQQALDRADVGVVDLGYRALAAKYAEVTEASVRVKFLAATASQVSGFDAANYGKVVDTVVDVQSLMNSRGEQVEFIVSTPDNFKKIAKLDHAGEFILSRNSGSIDIPGIKATLFGIPVYVLASGTGVFTFANSSAITVWESGVGRLTDSNIVNLTSAFSLYGYLGSAVTNSNAIVKAVA